MRLSPAHGRPPSKDPKGHRESFRMSDSDIEKLNFCIKKTGMKKVDVVRMGIDKVYKELKEKEQSL